MYRRKWLKCCPNIIRYESIYILSWSNTCISVLLLKIIWWGYILGLTNTWLLLIHPLLQLIYSGYSCSQGWFIIPCSSDPSLRSDISLLELIIFILMDANGQFIIPSIISFQFDCSVERNMLLELELNRSTCV